MPDCWQSEYCLTCTERALGVVFHDPPCTCVCVCVCVCLCVCEIERGAGGGVAQCILVFCDYPLHVWPCWLKVSVNKFGLICVCLTLCVSSFLIDNTKRGNAFFRFSKHPEVPFSSCSVLASDQTDRLPGSCCVVSLVPEVSSVLVCLLRFPNFLTHSFVNSAVHLSNFSHGLMCVCLHVEYLWHQDGECLISLK